MFNLKFCDYFMIDKIREIFVTNAKTQITKYDSYHSNNSINNNNKKNLRNHLKYSIISKPEAWHMNQYVQKT